MITSFNLYENSKAAPFKVGETVICIDASFTLGNLIFGKKYTVKHVKRDYENKWRISVTDDLEIFFDASRFIKEVEYDSMKYNL